MFLFNILEALLAYDHNLIWFLQTKEATLNRDVTDKNRGNQMKGPGCLQKVLKDVNWLLSPIVSSRASLEL